MIIAYYQYVILPQTRLRPAGHRRRCAGEHFGFAMVAARQTLFCPARFHPRRASPAARVASALCPCHTGKTRGAARADPRKAAPRPTRRLLFLPPLVICPLTPPAGQIIQPHRSVRATGRKVWQGTVTPSRRLMPGSIPGSPTTSRFPRICPPSAFSPAPEAFYFFPNHLSILPSRQ